MNPLTYQIDAIRSAMIMGGRSAFGTGPDFCVMLAVLAAIVSRKSPYIRKFQEIRFSSFPRY